MVTLSSPFGEPFRTAIFIIVTYSCRTSFGKYSYHKRISITTSKSPAEFITESE